jgi:hypothetical protein
VEEKKHFTILFDFFFRICKTNQKKNQNINFLFLTIYLAFSLEMVQGVWMLCGRKLCSSPATRLSN